MSKKVCGRCRREREDVETYEVEASIPFKIDYCKPCGKKVAEVRKVTKVTTIKEEVSAEAAPRRLARPTRPKGRAEKTQAGEAVGAGAEGAGGVESARERATSVKRGPGGKFVKKASK